MPQVAAGWAAHLLAGSVAPAGTGVQVPALPVSAHDMHVDAQAVAQQIPCAQVFDTHSALVEHEAPLGLRPHELPAQAFPVEHSALVAQAEKHFDPLQANGAQAMASGAAQLPLASQLAAGV